MSSARDLDGDGLRQAFRDFIGRLRNGPDAVAAVYFAGYGLQLEGEGYLVPIDAVLVRLQTFSCGLCNCPNMHALDCHPVGASQAS